MVFIMNSYKYRVQNISTEHHLGLDRADISSESSPSRSLYISVNVKADVPQ